MLLMSLPGHLAFTLTVSSAQRGSSMTHAQDLANSWPFCSAASLDSHARVSYEAFPRSPKATGFSQQKTHHTIA